MFMKVTGHVKSGVVFSRYTKCNVTYYTCIKNILKALV